MKKGFSLLELSVVIVVVGIIIVFGLKISSAVRTARLKKDIMISVIPIQNGFVNFVERHGRFPGSLVDSPDTFSYNNNAKLRTEILKSGMLTSTDFEIPKGRFSVTEDLYWAFAACGWVANGFVYMESGTGNICLTMARDPDKAPGGNNYVRIRSFGAGFELYYDDANYYSGSGRKESKAIANTDLQDDLETSGIADVPAYSIRIW